MISSCCWLEWVDVRTAGAIGKPPRINIAVGSPCCSRDWKRFRINYITVGFIFFHQF